MLYSGLDAPAAAISRADVNVFIGAVIAMAEFIESHYYLWRPQLRVPGTRWCWRQRSTATPAAIVTFNVRDYGASAAKFGIALLTPSTALMRIG